MSNLYRYLLPKDGGGWLRRYYQHKKLLVSMELRSSDATPMLPIPIFDFHRTIDAADAARISSTTVDGWTVSDDGVINGASTSNAVLIRTSQCWQNHLQSTNHRIQTQTKHSTFTSKHTTNQHQHQQQQQQQQQQQSYISTEDLPQHPNDVDLTNDTVSNQEEEKDGTSIEILPRPYIRWYGNLNTSIGLESKVQRSGFCAIRSPIFPFDGASLQGLYSFLEIQCRYVPVLPTTTTTQEQSLQYSNNNTMNPPDIQIPNNSEPQSDPLGPTRIFTLNLRVTTALNDDIYQGFLALDHPPTTIAPTYSPMTSNNDENGSIANDKRSMSQHSLPPFRTFVIPFDELTLTARGRDREFQRRLMGSVDIESIGFLLMDNIEGPFQFDIAQIRAVNCLDDGTVFESPSQFSRATKGTSMMQAGLNDDDDNDDKSKK